MLAIAYAIGASIVSGQAGSFAECVSVADGSGVAFAVMNRNLFEIDHAGLTAISSSPIPGGSPAIACGGGGVVLENGEYWRWFGGGTGYPGEWGKVGSFVGPTPVTSETWGRVKSRYRTTPSTTTR